MAVLALDLPSTVLTPLWAHVREALPEEACGLLLGRHGRVHIVRPCRNVYASPTRYAIDPADHFAAVREARAKGLEVIGAYHSHPDGPAEPSPTDRAEAFSEFVFLIASGRTTDHMRAALRAWHLDGDDLVELPLLRHEAPAC